MPAELNVRSAVLCDDVRIENNGKIILIGVYSGNVAVPVTPFVLAVHVWINLSPQVPGEIAVNLRISFQGKPIVSGQGTITAVDTDDVVILLPKFLVEGDGDGELLVEMQEEDGSWSVLLRKKIVKRSDLFPTTPTGSSG
ncbi:MAG: hypothetical protein JNM75_01065 [Rhodospirillales bacterium]|nr:hypothetical protein [Rhodospirillales bacterium]